MTSSSRSKPGSTCCGSTATSPPRRRTTPPTSSACLLLQDFPLQWGYARSVRGAGGRPGARRGRPARPPSVDRAVERPQRPGGGRRSASRATARRAGCVTPPASSCRRGTRRARPVGEARRSSAPTRRDSWCHIRGVLPHFPQLDGTDSHFYFGWYHGDVRDIERLAAGVPRVVPVRVRVRRPGGAARRPTSSIRGDWPDLDWDDLDDRTTACRSGRSTSACRRPVRHLRRVAARHADVPGGADPAPHRGAAPAQVPAGGWVLRVRPQRPGAGRCRGACSTTRACRSSACDVLRRGLPAGDRRRRPAAVDRDAPASGSNSTCMRSTTSATRRPGRRRRRRRVGGGERRWRFGGAVGADECVKVGTDRVRRAEDVGGADVRPHADRRRHQGEEPLLNGRHRAVMRSIAC